MQSTLGDPVGLWLEFQIERSRRLSEELRALLVDTAKERPGIRPEPADVEPECSAAHRLRRLSAPV